MSIIRSEMRMKIYLFFEIINVDCYHNEIMHIFMRKEEITVRERVSCKPNNSI